jgi:hypothetical protein
MSDKKEIVIFMREGLAESLIADTFTFGCLCAAIYVSRGDTFWSVVCFVFLAVTVLVKALIFGGKQPRFFNWADASAYCIKKAIANDEITSGKLSRQESD